MNADNQHPPVGPTLEEVRAHFGALLPEGARLMRPAYTSIWALEDGTLLWSWRNGYEALDKPDEPTGPQDLERVLANAKQDLEAYRLREAAHLDRIALLEGYLKGKEHQIKNLETLIHLHENNHSKI